MSHHPALQQWLCAKIKQEGPIDFADFMQACLYHPQYGYYRQPSSVVGASGDFITSVTMGSLVAQTIHSYASQLAQKHGLYEFLEFGAGGGQFAKDFLQTNLEKGAPFSTYQIMEVASSRKVEQQATVAKLDLPMGLLSFLDGLNQASDFSGVGFANEVLDAFPVHYFKIDNDEIYVGKISLDEKNNFCWVWPAAAPDLVQTVKALDVDLADGTVGIINLALRGWLEMVYQHWHRGFLILIDYGGTTSECFHSGREHVVRGFRAHRLVDDPLAHIGCQDLTADVDFDQVAQHAQAVGWDVVSYMPQNKFLLEHGLLDIYESQLAKVGSADAYQLAQEVKQLVMPGAMGERFKVMVLAKI